MRYRQAVKFFSAEELLRLFGFNRQKIGFFFRPIPRLVSSKTIKVSHLDKSYE
jgi:hypothetical protein